MPAIGPDHPFLVKHQEQIAGVLSCFDRVIFRGYLPLSYPKGMAGFMYQQGVAPNDFNNYAPKIAERIKQHIVAEVAGAPYRFLARPEPMEELARRRAAEAKIVEGVVCGFGRMETCRTFRLKSEPGRARLRPDYRKCLVLYVFLMHSVLRLIHVKIHPWFPLTIQVYANGHDYLAKKLDGLGLKYALADNAFTSLENLKASQSSADRFAKLNWPKLLGLRGGEPAGELPLSGGVGRGGRRRPSPSAGGSRDEAKSLGGPAEAGFAAVKRGRPEAVFGGVARRAPGARLSKPGPGPTLVSAEGVGRRESANMYTATWAPRAWTRANWPRLRKPSARASSAIPNATTFTVISATSSICEASMRRRLRSTGPR